MDISDKYKRKAGKFSGSFGFLDKIGVSEKENPDGTITRAPIGEPKNKDSVSSQTTPTNTSNVSQSTNASIRGRRPAPIDTSEEGITKRFQDQDNQRNSNYAIPEEGLRNISKMSRQGNFTSPMINQPDKSKPVNSHYNVGKGTQAVIDSILNPLKEVKQGSEQWASGNLDEGSIGVGSGLLHGAMAVPMLPFSIGEQILRSMGPAGDQAAQGINDGMNMPFTAARNLTKWIDKGLETAGVDPKKIDKALGGSPETQDKAKNLLVELIALLALQQAHGAGKVGGIPKSIQDLPMQDKNPLIREFKQKPDFSQVPDFIQQALQGSMDKDKEHTDQTEKKDNKVPEVKPNEVIASADPKSRLIVNDLEKFVNDAVKRKSKINESSITSQLNNVIDPKEKLRLEELYIKALEHNKNLNNKVRPLNTEGENKGATLNTTNKDVQKPEIKIDNKGTEPDLQIKGLDEIQKVTDVTTDKPKIISTAINTGDRLIKGENPFDSHDDISTQRKVDAPESQRGFIVNENGEDRFIDRKEAAKIAKESGQVPNQLNELHSENLRGNPNEVVKPVSTLNLRGSKNLSNDTKRLIAENDKLMNRLVDRRVTHKSETSSANEKRAALSDINKITAELRSKGLNIEYGGGHDKNIRIDGKAVVPVEEAPRVNINDVKINDPKAEQSFEQMPKEEVDKQIALSKIVEASDLDKGLGKKVIEKGVKDIEEDHGKELSPEAKAVRDAALQKEKDGVKVGDETLKGEDLLNAVKQGSKSDLDKAKAHYESMRDDVFATPEEIEAAKVKYEDLLKTVKPKAKVIPEDSLFKGEDNKPVMRTDKGLHDGEIRTNEDGTPLFDQEKTDKEQGDIFNAKDSYNRKEAELNSLKKQLADIDRKIDLTTSEKRTQDLTTERNRIEAELLKTEDEFNQLDKPDSSLGFKLVDKDGNEYLPISKEGNSYRAIDKSGNEVIRNVKDPEYPNRDGDVIQRDFKQNDKSIKETKRDFLNEDAEDQLDREADSQKGNSFASESPDKKNFKTARKDNVGRPERKPVDLRAEKPNQALKKAVTTFAKGADGIKKMFAPASRGENAKMTAATLREETAKVAHERELMHASMKEMGSHFDRQDPYYNIDVIDGAERGTFKGTPEEQLVMRSMMKILRDKYNYIKQMKNGDVSFIENYFPHIWKDPEKATEILGKIYSKKPFEGTRSFQKQRSIPFTKDGIDLGLEPVSTNPVDLFLAKNYEMDRYIMAHDVFNDMKSRGLTKYFRIGEKAPEGWVKLNDRIGTAFGNPNIEISEAYDKHIMDGLNKVAKGLGIDPERKVKIGGHAWGYASETGETVTKFGGPESVLAHEIGHQLDFKYGLKDQLVNNPEFKKELRALADLRYEGMEGVEDSFKKYVRKGEEKMAVMLESYIHAPEKFKEVAPKTYKFFTDFLKSKPELKGILDIKPSLVLGTNTGTARVGGMVINGYYYMPEQAATILNNYLSPGLSGKVSYDLLRKSGNLMNQVQLSMSAFHAGFTTLDVITSKTALGVLKLSQGRILEGTKDIISSPMSPITNLIKGDKLLKAYYGKNPELTSMVNDIVKAGGRVRMDSFFKNNAVEGWLKAWRGKKVGEGIIRTPGALIEAMAKPLMEELVPRQKLGVFYDLAKNINDEAIRKNLTPDEVRTRMQEAWDSVDNRMGQLVYDNLFWNKSLKDLGMASVRSLGWNIGDIRELGGAPIDLAKQLKSAATGNGFRVTPRMSYAVSLPITMGVIGGITHYLYTGEAPKETKDYFFPKTGKKNPDGTDERVSLPSYMKDVYAYQQKPLTTVSHKLHPIISASIDMLNNKDYYGYEIRNSGDPLVKQFQQEMEYAAEQFIPFSIRSAQQRKDAGESLGRQAQGFVGLNPAPKYITNSSLQNEIGDLYQKRFGGNEKPYDQKETDKIKREIRGLVEAGNESESQNKLEQYIEDGKISLTGRQTQNLFKASDMSFDVYAFKRLPQSDKAKLWDKMSEKEKEKFGDYYDPDKNEISGRKTRNQ